MKTAAAPRKSDAAPREQSSFVQRLNPSGKSSPIIFGKDYHVWLMPPCLPSHRDQSRGGSFFHHLKTHLCLFVKERKYARGVSQDLLLLMCLAEKLHFANAGESNGQKCIGEDVVGKLVNVRG